MDEGQPKGEGILTDKLLRKKLRRGKGPLVRLSFGQSKKGKSKQDFRQGLR